MLKTVCYIMGMTSLYGLDKILNTGVLREEKVEGFQTQHVFFFSFSKPERK